MVRVTGVERIGRITGEDSCNATASRFGFTATDLGIMWDDGRGGVLIAFGDTYGEQWGGHGAGPKHADWRCNVLARSSNTDLDGGVRFDWTVQRPDGSAAQFIPRDASRRGTVAISAPGTRDDTAPGLPGTGTCDTAAPDGATPSARDGAAPAGRGRTAPSRRENTVIPTSGICVGGRNYVHYMSVRRWGVPGAWQTGYSGLAHSDDGGLTWTKSTTAVWPNTRQPALRRFRRRDQGGHPFQMIAFAGVLDDGRVHLIGTPSGRFGSGHLARTSDLLDPAAYEYRTSSGWSPEPLAAEPVLSAPVAELSVQYNSHFGRWFAVHLDEHRAAIVLRTAEVLTGPWSPARVLATDPGLYGGFQHPWAADRPSIFFAMTRWGPYNVDLLRADLACS